ncbi:MAG: aspartate/glutamate racemase family protein [Gammaproteobacteria bacterium]
MTKPKVLFEQRPPHEPLEKIGALGRIGLVALGTDVNSETDLRRMTPDGVEIFTNRVANQNPTTVENLRAMAPDITRAAAGILPGDSLDLLIYACTSGTAVIGEAEVFRLLRAAREEWSELPCTTPVSAALAALARFGAKRISLLTPYIEPVNRELADFFHAHGIDPLNVYGFGIASDADMSGVSHASIVRAARAACREDADLLFISCTALRAAQVIEEIETEIGKPVITSNQAMIWHALQLLRRPLAPAGFGKLFAMS